MRRLVENQSGNVLLLTMIMIGLLIGIGLVILRSTMSSNQQDDDSVMLSGTIAMIRNELQSMMSDTDGGKYTIQSNSNMNASCLGDWTKTCSGSELQPSPSGDKVVLKDSYNNTFYDSTDPNAGFRLDGSLCDNFTTSPDHRLLTGCIIHVELHWMALCVANPCKGSNAKPLLYACFQSSISDADNLNPSIWNGVLLATEPDPGTLTSPCP